MGTSKLTNMCKTQILIFEVEMNKKCITAAAE